MPPLQPSTVSRGVAEPPEATRRVPVFGLEFTDDPLDVAARRLVASAESDRRLRVLFVNAHCVNVSTRDRQLQAALKTADVAYADGVGMALAARLQGQRLRHNVNGTDLFPQICAEAARARLPIALLGGRPGTAEACADAIRRQHPGVDVAWCHHGYIDADDHGRVIDGINRSGARMLFVAMGVPRQECWIMHHFRALRVPVVLGVGGLFDFVAGNVPRAPLPVRRLRLEWLFRLAVEPRRLASRYLVGNPLFLAHAARFAVTGRLWAAAPGASGG